MSRFFCGIDAGGTSCRAALLSADGKVFGWGEGPGANPNHAGWEGAGASMCQAIQAACEKAGIATRQITSVFLGMAGVISAQDRTDAAALGLKWDLSPECRLGADHDLRIALEGGLSGRPGIVIIAGTGSSCYGRNAAGEAWQSGGWDRNLDDLGSGYDLAQKGMAAACQSADGRLGETRLKELFFEALGVGNVVDFSVIVHRPGLQRHEIAALAPLVMNALREGDKIAAQIVSTAAMELARMIEAVTVRLFPEGNPEVVPIGGLLEKSSDYRTHVESAVSSRVKGARFQTAELRPAVGAVAIAAEQQGHTLDSELLRQLSELNKS